MKTEITQQLEIKYLSVLFFIFGFGPMAWVPRFPEVKAHLDINNGTFGTILSIGGIGALLSLIFTGHIVHKYGVKRILTINIIILYISLNGVVNVFNSFIFLILNLSVSVGISGFHIASHSQVFDLQERHGRFILSRFHGMWAVGALSTAILSGLLVNRVDIRIHIGVLTSITFGGALLILSKMQSSLVGPSEDHEPSVIEAFKLYKIDWIPIFGVFCGNLIEFVTGDWATIYTREDIGISSGLNTIPYSLFMAMMIIGRLNGGKLFRAFGPHKTVRTMGLIGPIGFLTFLWLGHFSKETSQGRAFIFTCLAFAFAGIGSSIMPAAFLTVANSRATQSAAVILAQIGVITNVMIFFTKNFIAWTAQFTNSLAIAISIGALTLFVSAYLAKIQKS